MRYRAQRAPSASLSARTHPRETLASVGKLGTGWAVPRVQARPQGCATAGVEGPTGIDREALRFGGPEGSYCRRAGSV